MSGSVLVLGATSGIARAAAACFAEQKTPLYLAGRDVEELRRLACDLSLRYEVRVSYGRFDAEETGSHRDFLESVLRETGGLEGVLLAFGFLGDQRSAAKDFSEASLIIARNYTGAVSILGHCAEVFEARRRGFIIGISSVAGDRGRQSNYTYGSAKGALSLYLEGLRNRLHPSGVRVITVKPGFVDTAMTYGRTGLFLVRSPDYVGRRIVRSLRRRADVVYIPWFWRYIMLAVKGIPDALFKRLSL